jgi:hypothetical protein
MPTNTLDQAIKLAMEKINAEHESDLCLYLPHRNKPLEISKYYRMKESNKTKLLQLINKHLLSPSSQDLKVVTMTPLQEDIQNALKKVNQTSERALCLYIPKDGYALSYSTFNSYKKPIPDKIRALLKKHIFDTDPKKYPLNSKLIETPISFVIEQAMDKLHLEKESELHAYLKTKEGSFDDSFFKKLKKKEADQELWALFSDL